MTRVALFITCFNDTLRKERTLSHLGEYLLEESVGCAGGKVHWARDAGGSLGIAQSGTIVLDGGKHGAGRR